MAYILLTSLALGWRPVYTDNTRWAGYSSYGYFSSIEATIRIPSYDAQEGTHFSTWIGFGDGGYSCNGTIDQAGYEVNRKKPLVWYEQWDSSTPYARTSLEYRIPIFVHPGNFLHIRILYKHGITQYEFWSSHQQYRVQRATPRACQKTAEFIAEQTMDTYRHFSPVLFTSCHLNGQRLTRFLLWPLRVVNFGRLWEYPTPIRSDQFQVESTI